MHQNTIEFSATLELKRKDICHALHNEDRQFNTLVDLLINLSENNTACQERTYRVLEKNLNHHRKFDQSLSSLNFDYIKDQLNQIEFRIKTPQINSSLEKFLSKWEIQTLINQIDVLQPKAEVEIKETLEKVQRNIHTLEDFQKILQKQLEDLKRLVNSV